MKEFKVKTYKTLQPEFKALSVLDAMVEGHIRANYSPHFVDICRQRFDAEPFSVFAQNELLQVTGESFMRLFPLMKARALIPEKGGFNPGARAHGFDRYDQVGQADFVDAQGGDMNRADVSKEREINPVRMLGISFGYTLEDLLAAQFAGEPLDSTKADAAMEGYAQKEDDVLLYGDASRRIPGLLTNPATPQIILPNGAWGSGTSSAALYQDMVAMVNSIHVTSKERHKANVLLLPHEEYNLVKDKQYSTASDLTVLEYFKRNNPGVECSILDELATVPGLGGRALMAMHRDPRNAYSVIPMQPTMQPAQMKNFETVIPIVGKVGGVVWPYPMAGVYGRL